jgi:myosin heavy subunit
MKPKEQVRQLATAIGMDIDVFDKFYKELYDARTEINRELKSIKARIEVLPDEDVQEVNVSELLQEIKAANQSNQAIAEKERKLSDLAAKGKSVAEKIKSLEEELEGAKAIYTTIKEEYTALAKDFKTLTPIDTTELEAKLQNATKINELAAKSKQRKELSEQGQELLAKVQKIEEKMHAAEEKKVKLLNDGKLPLKGLSFESDGDNKTGQVTYNGIPLSQCSSAEQLKISFVIAMALNPKLKVILIRDGSLLDSGNMELIASMATKYGYQVWIEKVDESGKVGVVIEDGQIVKTNKKEPANV